MSSRRQAACPPKSLPTGARSIGTVDVEFGFSCMGYEIAGGWGARIAQSEQEPDATPSSSLATGPTLMMNSDIYSSVSTQKKLIMLVLDNGGFAVINKLQNNTGNESFNNLIADAQPSRNPLPSISRPTRRAMGAMPKPSIIRGFGRSLQPRQGRDKTSVIVMKVDAYEGWTTEGHTWWEVGTPEVSDKAKRSAPHMRDGKPPAPNSGRASDEALLDGIRRTTSCLHRSCGHGFLPDPPGTKTEEATHFISDLGGSAANTAAGIVKLGGLAALVTSVSDDSIGRFCLNRLEHYGVDATHVRRLAAKRAIRSRSMKAASRPSDRHLPQRRRRFPDDRRRHQIGPISPLTAP